MSGASKKLMGTTAAAGGQIDISDYFSTYLYTGNGSTQTITNGIDLAGEGGLVWAKARNQPYGNRLHDTERGATSGLVSNGSGAEFTDADSITSFNADGFSLGADAGTNGYNSSGDTFASWTFRKAPRFFDVVEFTTPSSSNTDYRINHSLGSTVGTIIVKTLDVDDDWYVYHRGTSSPNSTVMRLNLTFAEWSVAAWGSGPTSTDFGISTVLFGTNRRHVAYLFAHDPLGPSGDGSDGLIACGSYTGNGSTNGPEIDLGWEPQWVMIKAASTTGGWSMWDSMRGVVTGGNDQRLYANQSTAEVTTSGDDIYFTPTGFGLGVSFPYVNGSGQTYIYIAIRRGPMRAPTSGTEVFKTNLYTEIVSSGYNLETNFVTDLVIQARRNQNTGNYFTPRMTKAYMSAFNTATEAANDLFWDRNDGVGINAFFNNNSGVTDVVQMFRRAPGFFDVATYFGTGSTKTVPHNLTAAPELIFVKSRTDTGQWKIYAEPLGATKHLKLQSDDGEATSSAEWNNTAPTDSVFTLGSNPDVNSSGQSYIAYLFSTLGGISKVGSYTGNGSSQTIDCGFTAGARFVLIKRTDNTGDWYVWDTARGIVAANDPHLSLNTALAEVTTDDSIDPDSSGFIVNQVAATNINVSSASYIFYAVS